MTIHFGSPWLLVACVVPVFVVVRSLRGRRRVPGFVVPSLTHFVVPATLRQRLHGVPLALRLLGLLLFCFALGGPEISLHNEEISDIAILLDVSGSMLAEDIAPNRLRAAKEL